MSIRTTRASSWGTYAMLLVFVLLLGACSSHSEAPAKPVADTAAANKEANMASIAESESAEQEDVSPSTTRIFPSVMGDIEIPTHPQRIVTQGFLPYFLLFDVRPIGAPSWEIEYPHLAGLTDGIEDIGIIDSGSVEKILSLQPDLIVTVAQDMYESYSKIAPTIVVPYDQVGDAHTDIRWFGNLLNKQEEAEEWLASFDEKVAIGKAHMQTLIPANETFSIIGAFDKTHYIYGEGIYRGGLTVYKYLQLAAPAIIQEQVMDAGLELLEISEEVIPDYAGDHILLDINHNGKLDEAGSVWQSIPAVKNGHAHRLNTDLFGPYDPLAILVQIDALIEMFADHTPHE